MGLGPVTLGPGACGHAARRGRGASAKRRRFAAPRRRHGVDSDDRHDAAPTGTVTVAGAYPGFRVDCRRDQDMVRYPGFGSRPQGEDPSHTRKHSIFMAWLQLGCGAMQAVRRRLWLLGRRGSGSHPRTAVLMVKLRGNAGQCKRPVDGCNLAPLATAWHDMVTCHGSDTWRSPPAARGPARGPAAVRVEQARRASKSRARGSIVHGSMLKI